MANPKPCEHCGGDPVRHDVEYMSHSLDLLLQPVMAAWMRAVESMMRLVPTGQGGWSVGVYEWLVRRGWGQLLDEPDDKTQLLHQMLWQEANTRGIRMREFRPFGMSKGSFVAVLPDGRVLDFEGLPLPDNSRTVWWIDTKSTLRKKLAKMGVPVAMGGAALTKAGAHKIFNRIPHPVITKPVIGSASRHTTMHITNVQELDRAFDIARQLAPMVIIEQELSGAVYRPTLVDGKLIATLRRDQPHVVGDGIHTVEQLVAKANTHPARQGPYFHHLQLDADARQELAYQSLTPQSIPEKNRRVTLQQKITWGHGGTTTDVTDNVHPDNVALFEKVAKLLRAPVVGIDFIIDDISRSWQEQKNCGIIECNSMPFFDNHHLPFEGTPRNVAKHIWDLVDR